MFIRYSRFLSLIFSANLIPRTRTASSAVRERTTHLVLWLMKTQVGACPNVLEYTGLPDTTPQRHSATILGIKLSHLVFIYVVRIRLNRFVIVTEIIRNLFSARTSFLNKN